MRAWILIFCLWVAAGCVRPCEELADRVCERAGLESPECVQLTERSGQVGVNEQRACRHVLEMTGTLSKNR